MEDSPNRRIAQVFTSTLAAGIYGKVPSDEVYSVIFRQLLRAAYLGTLLSAAYLRHNKVVLTLIGGGAFENPLPLIWEAILWALEAVEPYISGDFDVFVNGRNDIKDIARHRLLSAVRDRGGALIALDHMSATIVR